MPRIGARVYNINAGEELLAQGFSLQEINLPCSTESGNESAWKNFTGRSNLTLLAHGPREGVPSDLDQLRNRYLPEIRLALEEGARLGVQLLTVHMWLESRFLAPDIIAAKIELLGQVVGWGAELGVGVALENLSESHADMDEAMRQIPGLFITLDLGHSMLLNPGTTAPQIIAHHFSRIRHLHLHDNHGGNSARDDLHLPPGQGKVPFAELFQILKKRGFNRTATLELKPHEMASARDWVNTLWGSV